MIGYINEKGQYVKGKKNLAHDVSPQYRGWNHDNQRKRFGRDIIQPYIGTKVNREFVLAYPEESKRYFTEDQIKQAERDLS